MKDILMKNKKIFCIVFPLFLILFVVYLAVYRIETLVKIGFSLFTKGGLCAEKIIFEEGSNKNKGKIVLTNSLLYGEKKYLIAEIPKTSIEYENWKIKDINIYNPKVNFVRDNNSYNIVDIFTGGKKEKSKSKTQEVKKEKKAKSDPLIGKINVFDGDLIYYDESYTDEIIKKVDKVNGYVKFFKGYEVDLEFDGVSLENNEEKVFIKYDNSYEKNDFTVRVKNINFNDQLFQYAYDSKSTIKDVKGLVNLDLTINDKGFFGKGTLENGSAKYQDLDMPITSVNLDVDFLGEKIVIDGDYFLDNYPGKFKLNYSKKDGVKVGFFLKDVFYRDAEKYKYLKNLNLNFSQMKLEKADIILSYKDKFKAEIDFSSKNGDKFSNISFKDINGKFIYEDDTFYLKDVYSKIFIKTESVEREILSNLSFKDGKGQTEIEVLGDKKNIFSGFKINFDFEMAKEKFLFELKSRILNLSGNYNYKEKNIELNQEKGFYLKYNLDKKIVEETKDDMYITINGYNIKTNLEFKNELLFVKTLLEQNKKKTKGFLDAEINLNNFDYWIKFDFENIKLSDEKGTLAGNYKGKIENVNKNLIGQCFVEKGTIYDKKNNIALRRIYGIVNLNNNFNKILDVTFDGEIGKLTTNSQRFKGIKTSVRYFDNKVEILDFRNRYLSFSGNLDLKKLFLNADIKFMEITDDVFKIDKLDYEIVSAEGNINGDLNKGIENIVGEIDIKEAYIILPSEKKINIYGKVGYKNREISSDSIFIDKNILSFNYSIKNEKGNYKLKIDENEIINVIPKTKMRIIGESSGKIERDRVRGNFNGELSGLKAGDKYLPKVSLSGEYNNDGIEFKDISFISNEKRKLARANGFIDFKDKQLDFELPKQKLKLSDFGLIIDDVDADLITEGRVKGPLSSPEYEIISQEGKIYIQNKFFGKTRFNIKGDKENVILEDISLKNGINEVRVYGKYDLVNLIPDLKLEASMEKFKDLNEVLAKYGVKNLDGKLKLNMEFNNEIPKGTLSVKDLSGDFSKFNLYLKNINGTIAVDEYNLKVKSLDGNINNGKLKISGDVKYNSSDKFTVDSFEKLSYNLVLEGKNIDYIHKNFVKINFSTRLRFLKNGIYGTININNGKISNITNKEFGIFKTIKEFLKRKTVDKGPVVRNLEIPLSNEEKISEESIKVNIRVNNENGIDVDIKNIAGYLTNVKGQIHSSGILSGTLENLNFLGESSIKEGEFTFNNKKFYVDRAAALFNDKNQPLLKANPEIIFITKTNINSEIYEISLIGPARKMDMYIKSGNEVSVSGINDILFSDGEGKNSGNENTVAFITELVGGQISDVVVSPIADVVRTLFGLSDLRVSSSIVSHEKKKNNEEDTGMTFGAYVEAESPIYKDKLFWKARFNFIDTAETTTSNLGMKKWVDYDLSIYQKINKNLSLGGGVQKLRKEAEMFDQEKNYYIEFKFEKKFDF